MNKGLGLLIVICFASVFSLSVFAQVNVGLKQGDWVEYEITYTGTPPVYYPETIRIEVLTIQGTSITLEIERNLINGTQHSRNETFDLEDGAPDAVIIPANLGAGDKIYHKDLGNFTIEGVADYNFKDLVRELIYANIAQAEFKWDRETGVLVQAEQTTNTFTQKLLAVDTNILDPHTTNIDTTLLYAVTITAVAILAVVGLIILKRKKQTSSKFSTTQTSS